MMQHKNMYVHTVLRGSRPEGVELLNDGDLDDCLSSFSFKFCDVLEGTCSRRELERRFGGAGCDAPLSFVPYNRELR